MMSVPGGVAGIRVGADCEDVLRFQQMTYDSKPHFYESLFDAEEIRHCLSYADPAPHFAGLFAAKEAVIKALTAPGEPVDPRVVRIRHEPGGRPYADISELGLAGRVDLDLSISHSATTAFAVCIAGGASR